MREIYSPAEEVLVWLGSGDRNTVEAIAACQDIMLSIQSVLSLSGFDFETLGVTNPDPWSGFQARPMTDTELNGLIDIMQRPWWDRVWVVQEVCLAREAKVIVGCSIMKWSKFTLSGDIFLAAAKHQY